MVAYRKELERKRRHSEESDVISLPKKRRERSLLLGEKIDAEVQLIIRNMRKVGGVINTAIIVISTTMGVLRKCNPDMLKKNEGLLTIDYYTELDLLNAKVTRR